MLLYIHHKKVRVRRQFSIEFKMERIPKHRIT